MRRPMSQHRQSVGSWATVIGCVILGGLLVDRLIAYARSNVEVIDIAKVAQQRQASDAKLQAALAKSQEKAETLKKKNLFAPPPGKPGAPVVRGILGSQAYINGKWYGVGDEVAGAKILAITAREVAIEWDGKRKSLFPNKIAESAEGSGPSGRGMRRRGRSERGEARVGRGGPRRQGAGRPGRQGRQGAGRQGRGGGGDQRWEQWRQRIREFGGPEGFRDMSPEERQQLRERFGGGRGGNRRGGSGN